MCGKSAQQGRPVTLCIVKIVSASEAVDMEVALCCVMTERKCGVDEEMEVGGRTGGGGQNQPAPL